MPQDDPIAFAFVLAAGLAFIVSGAWAVNSAIRDTRIDPLARIAVIAVLVLCFPIAAPLWLIAKSADLPSKLQSPLTFSARL